MLVKELKEILSTLDENWIVVLSKDGEGNSYSPLADYTTNFRYEPNSGWSGSIVGDRDCDENLREGEEPCDHSDCSFSYAEPAIVLWPTN